MSQLISVLGEPEIRNFCYRAPGNETISCRQIAVDVLPSENVCHCKSTVSGEAAAGSGHDITLPSNSTDIQTLPQALLKVTNSLSGEIQGVKDMKVRIEEERRGGGVAAVPLRLSLRKQMHTVMHRKLMQTVMRLIIAHNHILRTKARSTLLRQVVKTFCGPRVQTHIHYVLGYQ
ncbi:hypothetical protein ElyMa_006042900 [Elysia marginata]|uniref:Uncharacterized protein n=1 Tax=Elysia marginata TaxID=1093978 RepID=A0AAV4GLV6_9GAST|nr:hypothetical protein ElyMa_006042900 [Elysia marginata]